MKATALFSLALLVACDTSMTKVASAPLQQVEVTTAQDMAGRGVAMQPVFAAEAAAPKAMSGRVVGEAPLSFVAPSNMIIRNGTVSVEVDSLEVAIDRVRDLARSLGGYLGNVSMQTGERQVRSASLEMKIPAARFDSAMTGMPGLGKVEQATSTAEDVGEEWVDVGARVANSKRLEARLLSLITTRTGKLTDVIAVERELARVRQEIERYEGRMRFLGARVATSTIVANVHEKAPIIAAAPGTNIFTTAFLNMGRNFVGFLAGGIELMGLILPVAAIAWLALLGWRRWRRQPPVAA